MTVNPAAVLRPLLGLCASLALASGLHATTINAVPVNGSYDTISGVYSVSVDDGAGGSVTPVSVVKHWVNYSGSDHANVYYAHFSFGGGAARVKVTLNSFTATSTYSYVLSPKSYALPASQSGNVVTFTLTDSRYVMLQVKDSSGLTSTYPCYLLIFADALETNVPSPTGAGVYNIANYGAVGNYSSDSYPAFQSAFTDASAYAASHGSATVYVPVGVFKVAHTINLASNVNLYLAPGAIVRADTTWTDWPGGSPAYLVTAPSGVSNATVYGRGTFDCKGIAVGGDAAAKNNSELCCGFKSSGTTSGITFDGVVFRESTGWMFHPTGTDGLTVQNVKVVNYAQDWNNYRENDGIDLIGCSNSRVNHSFVFTEDDAVCLKGGTSSSDTAPVSNCVYNDMVLYTHADGVKFGMQAYTAFIDSYFQNVDIVNAKRGIAIHLTDGSADLDTIGFGSIRCENVESRPVEFLIANGSTGSNVSNVWASGVSSTNFGPTANEITGASSSAEFNGVAISDLSIANQIRTQPYGTGSGQANFQNPFTNAVNVMVPFAQSTNLANGLSPTSQSANWKTSGSTVTYLTNGLFTDEAQTTDTADAQVVYNFVQNRTITSASIYQDNGGYSAQSWKMEYWDSSSHTWLVAFDFTPCPFSVNSGTTPIANTVNFAPVVGTGVRITLHPYSGKQVGINEVQVTGF